MAPRLPNAPLLETIFELKWQLKDPRFGGFVDNNYSLLIGAIRGQLKEKYSFHEALPQMAMPEEVASYIVQHRFRRSEGEWPLYQLGPGIITFNQAKDYHWDSYLSDLKELISVFLNEYPKPDTLKLTEITLRYIDGLNFNYETDNVLSGFKDNLNIDLNGVEKIFSNEKIKLHPLLCNLLFNFPTISPKGVSALSINRGQIHGEDGIIIETAVVSKNNDVPQTEDEIFSWIEESHVITHDLFDKLFAPIMDEFKREP